MIWFGLLSFHFSEETFTNSDVSFPSLKNRQDWYHIPLFVSRQPDTITRLKYDALNKSVRKALRSCGIHCRASTHTSRKWGAQLTEDGGAPEEDIMRQGRWCTKVMETVYLSKFPLKALRSLAGFPKKERLLLPSTRHGSASGTYRERLPMG